ncbi:MAG: non-heme iron oxygenase ferredoxin subunit [Clostridia bacterium]
MAAWQAVARAEEVLEGLPIQVLVNGAEICLLRAGDDFFAIDNLCTHAEASLSEGAQDGRVLECPRHGGRFDIETGAAVHYPAFAPVRTYPVRREGDTLLIQVD